MMRRTQSKERKISNGGPVFMTSTQMTSYLADLRTNRPTRPTGARPAPPSNFRSVRHSVSNIEMSSNGASMIDDGMSVKSQKRSSICSIESQDDSQIYQETCGSRWIEKQEARSIRAALEQIDLEEKSDDTRIYNEAQKEAEELINQHHLASKAEDVGSTDKHRKYMEHLKRGSHFRSLSKGAREGILVKKSRSVSGSSSGSGTSDRVVSDGSVKSLDSIQVSKEPATRKRSVHFNLEPQPLPCDEPIQPVQPVSKTAHFRSPFMRIRASRNNSVEQNSIGLQNGPGSVLKGPDELNDLEEPTRMRDGVEIRSDDIRKATSKSFGDRSPNLPNPVIVSNKPNRPIVSFDKNFKPQKEPKTHFISTTAPVVDNSRAKNMPSIPTTSLNDDTKHVRSIPPIPIISLPDDEPQRPSIPMINLPDDEPQRPSIPIINLPDDEPQQPSISISNIPDQRIQNSSIPQINIAIDNDMNQPPKPIIRHLPTTPAMFASPASPSCCNHCLTPIAGRIVTAGRARLHPACFKCHRCAERLDVVAFYPEPDNVREERLNQQGQATDKRNRFYCHLDFHELFSPRCKSCKTPIEGEMVVACGANWHAGHFFCAQCGDPFSTEKPFVEKDGYAWCVECHTNRFSSKCKKCRKPLVGKFIRALEADWHEECFVCTQCHGSFENGQYFLRDGINDPYCPTCEETRFKNMSYSRR